jgi:SnoaL-like domain
MAMVSSTREAAERFARTWQQCWSDNDAAPLAALYAEDCVHRSMPFRPVHQGQSGVLDYIAATFTDEPADQVSFGPPLVDGAHAPIEFWALLTRRDDGQPTTLAGCVLLRFQADGLVAEARDYWHVCDGHRQPEGTLFLSP